MAHPLAGMLDAAAHGRFPDPDGRVEVVGVPPDGSSVLACFTARTVVALDVDPSDVARRVLPHDLSASMAPVFVRWLEDETGLHALNQDAVLATIATGGEPSPVLEPLDAYAHPRVDRASLHRVDVRVFATPDRDGVVVLGRGVTRRWEVAFEVDEDARGRGTGRGLLQAARTLLPAGTPMWMQVAPGNARSLRAATAAGFRSIGSEILFVPRP